MSLGELSIYEKIIWKFPKTNICPLDECEQSFSNPTNCVEHFCQRHAVTAMLCSVCNQIFSTEKLAAHYKVNHPDKDSPKLKSVIIIIIIIVTIYASYRIKFMIYFCIDGF